ncbi:hypothetical protein like AT5G35732 [Hibiscus trionum]|uniref:Uncharacterized protein n=1 Tax=Hibiscus trionum TaxID=183268 RepID=A0A9W7IL03_HIBTR|nr:hypothetical protein like AT5G35732 [Hibiscus trionum]
MWRMLVALRRNLQNIKKSHRVADENMVAAVVVVGGNNNNNNNNGVDEMPVFVDRSRTHGSWNRKCLSVVCSVVRAPFTLVSCFSQPHVNGADGVWVSGHEFAQISEMVSNSMRYAILM